jgi:hypothetical protein
MTMPLPATTPANAPSAALDRVLRIVVFLFGMIEGILHLSDLSILSGDITRIPGADPEGLMFLAAIVLHPVLGFAAAACALTKKLRLGLAALALLALMPWVRDLPSLIREGFQMSGSAYLNADAIFRTAIQPVIGLGALSAAWLNRHLTAATLALTLPTLVKAAGIAAFAISVMLYGF